MSLSRQVRRAAERAAKAKPRYASGYGPSYLGHPDPLTGRYRQEQARRADPEKADGIPRGPDGNKIGKGCKDGYCNRTTCQAALAGQVQWTMEAYSSGGTNGRLYYCDDCAGLFNRCDRDEFPQDRRGMAMQRCRLELDTVPDDMKDYYLNSRYVRGEPWKVQA